MVKKFARNGIGALALAGTVVLGPD